MTTSVLDRPILPGRESGGEPVAPPRAFDRPPTLFGRTSPADIVSAGHGLALRAIGYAAEGVPRVHAIHGLLGDEPSPEALHLAWDYLAFTRFDVPSSRQVDALLLVEDARAELHRRHQALHERLARLQERGRDRMRNAWARAGAAVRRVLHKGRRTAPSV